MCVYVLYNTCEFTYTYNKQNIDMYTLLSHLAPPRTKLTKPTATPHAQRQDVHTQMFIAYKLYFQKIVWASVFDKHN